MRVFIAGSRHVSRLDAGVCRRLDNMIEKRLPILVGDANGADKAVQAYLHGKHYDLVQVYCSGDDCRNNVGAWPVAHVAAAGGRRDFGFYATKDRAMAKEASHGLMIWDGKSVGTLMNAARLVGLGKPVVVYTAPAKTFTDLKRKADWEAFVSDCNATLRERIDRELAAEAQGAEQRQPAGQTSFL